MNLDLVKKIFRRVLLWSGPICILIFLFSGNVKASILGYVFGVIISMLVFLLLKESVEKSVRLDPDKASRYATGQYFVRMLIQGVVLIIAAKADYLSFLTVVLGLLMVKIVITLSSILDRDYLRRKK